MDERTGEIVERARAIADEVLFPAALTTDASPLLPRRLLDVLADAGFYGLVGPTGSGGLAADGATVAAVVEALAGGCLTTTFVWMQHLGSTQAVARSDVAAVRDEWARPLSSGDRRAGVAFAHLRRPGPPVVRATPCGGGWRIDGIAPWVTGWGRIDAVHVAARCGDDIVWSLIDAVGSTAVRPDPLALAAVDASGTVELHLTGLVVPPERVTIVEPYSAWAARDAAGSRTNGSLALGVASRCTRLLGPSPFDDELVACREALDRAGPDEFPAARAAASVLAHRAAGALVAAGGGSAVRRDHHAQRLAREAMFLLVQAQNPAIRAAQAQRFAP